MVIVSTEKALERALEAKEKTIILEGPQASEIVRKITDVQKKKRRIRKTGIGIGLICIIGAPITGGMSLLGLGATVGAIAISDTVIVAIISAIVSISTVTINRMYDYKIKKLDNNRIEFSRK